MHKLRKLIFIFGGLIILFLMLLSYSIWIYYKQTYLQDSYNPDINQNQNSMQQIDSDNPTWWNTADENVGNPCLKLNCSSDTVYVGSKLSKKYYECFCGWSKIVKQKNLICFKSDEEAMAINYTKSVC